MSHLRVRLAVGEFVSGKGVLEVWVGLKPKLSELVTEHLLGTKAEEGRYDPSGPELQCPNRG